MTYYTFIKNGEIIGKGFCKSLNEDTLNLETLNPDYEAQKAMEERQVRIDEIKAELEEIDRQSQRSARAIALCAAAYFAPSPAMTINENQLVEEASKASLPEFNPEDIEKLSELENRAKELREELQELEDPETLQTAEEKTEELISEGEIPF